MLFYVVSVDLFYVFFVVFVAYDWCLLRTCRSLLVKAIQPRARIRASRQCHKGLNVPAGAPGDQHHLSGFGHRRNGTALRFAMIVSLGKGKATVTS